MNSKIPIQQDEDTGMKNSITIRVGIKILCISSIANTIFCVC